MSNPMDPAAETPADVERLETQLSTLEANSVTAYQSLQATCAQLLEQVSDLQTRNAQLADTQAKQALQLSEFPPQKAPKLQDMSDFSWRPSRFTRDLPAFTGEKEDVDRWFFRLDTTFRSYQMDKHPRIMYIQAYPLLVDNAFNWWHSQGERACEEAIKDANKEGEELDEWAAFKMVMLKRFSNVRSALEAAEQLYRLRQAYNEPVDELIDRFDRLMAIVDIPTIPRQEKRFLYTALLPVIRERVATDMWEADQYTLDSVKAAIYVAERQAKDRGDLRYKTDLNSYPLEDTAVSMELGARSANKRGAPSKKFPKPRPQHATSAAAAPTKSSRPPPKPEASYVCFNCQVVGKHYRRDCPHPPRSTKPATFDRADKGKAPKLSHMSAEPITAAAKPSSYKAAVGNSAGAGPSSSF